MTPDAETLARVSRGIRACADMMGARCSTVARFAVLTDAARKAGIRADGVLETQEQAEAMLALLRQWYVQARQDRRRRERKMR